jgi:hypothetical protein
MVQLCYMYKTHIFLLCLYFYILWIWSIPHLFIITALWHFMQTLVVIPRLRGGADKSLAPPGRKQALATKLGMYSTCTPWCSIHFLARCSNFCKPLKKNSESCPSNQVSTAAMTSATSELFFQSKEQVVVWGHIQRMGWVFKTLEAQLGQFPLGCKCPVSWGIVMQKQDPLGDCPHVRIFMNDRPNLLTWDYQLLGYCSSWNLAKDLSAPPCKTLSLNTI